MDKSVPVFTLLFLLAAPLEAAPTPKPKFNPASIKTDKAFLKKANLYTITNLAKSDKQAVQEKNGKGPENLPIDLATLPIGGVNNFPEIQDLQSFTNLSLKVYPERLQGVEA